MGQYYKPTNLDRREFLYTHDFKSRYTRQDGTTYTCGQGLKLMEHSYISNKMMRAVERLLIPGGDWYKNRLVWAGDYADQEPGYKKTPEGYNVNIYAIMEKEGKKVKPSSKPVDKAFHFLVNHTRKQVIDLAAIKPDKNGYKIHPLPLLVAEGNGRGGGDFHGEDSRIGIWARHVISLENHILERYNLIDGQFIENRE
mgnify:CR=1 FL=1